MIYTITFNPALDYISQVENFQKGKINRTTNEKILPGGKGLNVSIVLKNLWALFSSLNNSLDLALLSLYSENDLYTSS